MKFSLISRILFPVLCFGGGGGAPKAPPRPDPPVTERKTEVKMAERQTRLDARRRKGALATVFAGETGGYQNNATTGGNSLLGE